MKIEWFHNGRLLDAGSRIHMIDDFGFVVLDIDWTFPRDSGEYLCRATNKWGSATTSARITCKGMTFQPTEMWNITSTPFALSREGLLLVPFFSFHFLFSPPPVFCSSSINHIPTRLPSMVTDGVQKCNLEYYCWCSAPVAY